MSAVALVQKPEAAPEIAAVPSENGSKGGRPTSLEKLGIRQEDIWNLATEGLTNSELSKRLSRSKGKISIRTIAKYRAIMPLDWKAKFDNFDSLPQAQEFKTWIKSRWNTEAGVTHTYNKVKEIWENCWKKPLESLVEADITNALAWIKENNPNSQFEAMLAVRALIRFGLGKPEWLTKLLNTKGKKNEPRTIGILTRPDFFTSVLPRILSAIFELDELERIKDELWLIISVKVATGIRTGDRKAERELWGTRINAGKTNLEFRAGKVEGWTVFAKRREIWHISYLPEKVRLGLVRHISKYGIKSGEPLIQALTDHRALELLAQICKSLDIERLDLHAFRKAYLTGLCLSGIPLETAVELNVGWKDINTARKHYLQIKALNADKEYNKFSTKFFQ